MTELISVPGVGEVRRSELRRSYRILLVEDDEQVVDTVRELLKSRGLTSIDVAKSAGEATSFVKAERYDAILADVLLEPSPRRGSSIPRGDEWLIKSAAQTVGSYCVAVTGHEALIGDRRRLEEMKIPVIRKGTDEEFQLYEDLEAAADAKIEEDMKMLQRQVIDMLINQPRKTSASDEIGSRVAEESRSMLIEWLEGRADMDSRDVWLGSKPYSARDLLKEVKDRSDIGQKLMLSFTRFIRARLRFASSKGNA